MNVELCRTSKIELCSHNRAEMDWNWVLHYMELKTLVFQI